MIPIEQMERLVKTHLNGHRLTHSYGVAQEAARLAKRYRTKDILKQAIKDFNGTVIVVSHDREFLDGLVEKVYEFGGGKVKECLGGIYEFLEKKKIASLAELEIAKSLYLMMKSKKVWQHLLQGNPPLYLQQN